MESSDHFCFIFWTRLKKHIASAAVDCRHIVVLPLTVRVSFSCPIGSCGCFPVSFQPVLVPWILLRLLFVTSRPQTCINTISIIGDFYLCDGSSSLPDRRGFHPISLIVPPKSTTSSVPSSIASWSSRLMLLWNQSIASDRFVSAAVSLIISTVFVRLMLQQSVQHCLRSMLLQHHQPTCRSNLFFLIQRSMFKRRMNHATPRWRRGRKVGENGVKKIQVCMKFKSQQIRTNQFQNPNNSLTWTRRRTRGAIKTNVFT